MSTIRERLGLENTPQQNNQINQDILDIRKRLGLSSSNVAQNVSVYKPQNNVEKTEKKKWYQDIFSSGAFSDGYQFGDVTKTLLGTGADIAVNTAQGVAGIGDSAAKLVAGGVAEIADFLGADKYANKVRNNLKTKTNPLMDTLNKTENITSKNSISGSTLDSAIEGVGQYGGMAALQSVGVPWQLTSGVTSAGNELQNAYANDAKGLKALVSAGIAAGAEIGSEYISGGLKLPGTGKTLDKITSGFTDKIANKTLKVLSEYGLGALGEGTEEVISGLGSALGRKLTYMSEKEFNEIYSKDEALEDFVVGTLTSALSSAPGTINSIVKNNTNELPSNPQSNQKNNNIPTVQDLVKRSDNPFKYEKTDNQKVNNVRESASKYFDNSENTHNLINNIEKIVVDKGYNVVFDDSITNPNGDIINGKISTLKNGEIEMRINPNSPRAGEFIVMHELTHAIETESMKDLVLNYASKHAEFNEALKSLQKTYGTDDVSSEVLADISGQLFGNQEFINSLSLEKPSIFRKIYNAIISLANKITGNSNEALFLKDLENKWREAYRTQYNNINGNISFSIQEYNGLGNIAQYDGINYITDSNENIQKNIKLYFDDNFKGLNINNINIDQSRKYAYPGTRQSNYTQVKAPSVTIINDILSTLENKRHQNDKIYNKDGSIKKHSNLDTSGGFNHYDTKIGIPNNNGEVNIFVADVITRIDKNGNEYFYDLDKIKDTGQKVVDNKSKPITDSSVSFNNKNIPQSNNNVNSGTKYSMQENVNNTQNLKQQQLNIILNSNPAGNDTATWIRNIDDIKTFEETLQDSDWSDYVDEGFNPDYTGDMVQEALDSGKIMVYSSYPIEQGIFVTPSKMEAESYSGTGKVYSKEVRLEDVAWIDPTQGQYAKVDGKYSQNSGKWQEYIEKYYKSTGTKTNLQNILIPSKEDLNQNIAPVSDKTYNVDTTEKSYSDEEKMRKKYLEQGKNRLTSEEYKELYALYSLDNIGIDLDAEDSKRMQYLENKSRGLIKYPELSAEVTFDDIKSKYSKYKDLSDFDSSILNKAKSNIAGYQNTGKKTKQQWLDIASFIGSNLNAKTSEALEKYAIQSWHEATPNTKDTLNRQGKKYVKFTIDEWINAVYEGAGVGTVMQEPKINDNQIAPIANQDIAPTKTSQKYSQDDLNNLQTIEDKNNNDEKIPNVKEQAVNNYQDIVDNYSDYKESKFYKNATETSQFITQENRDKLKKVADLQYYKGISNEETLKQAQIKLDNGGDGEIGRWLTQDDKVSEATDVAEGWILLSRYQEAGDYDSMVAVAKKMRRMGTTAGQTVQAYNIMARLTPEGMVKYAQSELTEAYEIYSKNKSKEWIDKNASKFDLTPEETGYIVDTMKEVEKMPDGREKTIKLAEIQKMLNDKLPPSKGDSIKAWMRISMLFNPKTQVRNVLGNAVIAPVNILSDFISSKVDSAIANKTGVRTTGTTSLKSYGKGFTKGVFESYDDFRRSINTRDMQGNRFEVGNAKSFNDNTKIGKALNKVDNLLGFMLDAGDRGFYEASFVNSINNQLVLNNKTEVTQEMIDIATKEALQRTWQDSNDYTRFVLNIRNTMNKINIKGYGLGDILIPFAKTPANLTKAIVDYSPLGMVKTINEGINLKKSLSNGQYNAQMQHQFVQDLGKATAGTMLYIAGLALAKAGVTSGESDDDKDVSNFMKNTLGISSYSIKIGNKTFSYDWMQPVAAPLAITANIVNKQKQNANLLENITSSLDTAGNILLEQSFLDSLNTVFSNNDGIVTGLEEAIMELPSRAIPTFMKQITDMIDKTQRTSFEYDKPLESMVNKVKAKIPGLSQTLAPTVDTMGREIQKYGGKADVFNVFINPANVNTENISKSAEEIYRLYKTTGDSTIMPRVAPYYINRDGQKTTLNSKQREKYQKVSGQIIENGINNLLKKNNYKKMSDDEKVNTISDLVNYSYNIAQKDVLNIDLSDKYQKVYDYSKFGEVSDYYLFTNSIDDTDKETKKESINNYLLNSDLNNKQLAYLYGSYYSSEKTLNNILNANIPMKEFIKFNSQKFESDYTVNGKIISDSAKNKVIKFVNNLELSIPQKALLIKSKYSSYKSYDKQIVDYIKSQEIDFLDKARILKQVGFTSFDKEIIDNINQRNLSVDEKTKILEDMGFKIRDGRVYSK